MIETLEKHIGSHEYMVTQLPARRALRLKAKLIKIFGPSLTQLILCSQDKEPDIEKLKDEQEKFHIREIQKESLVKGIQLLAESIDDKTFDELCIEIMQGVRRDGIEILPATLDHLFAGKLLDLYKVILFVLEVNFSDFLDLSGIGNQFTQTNPQETSTKKTYTYK